jgi:hypothetical protein
MLGDTRITQVEPSGKLTDGKLVTPDQAQDALSMGFCHQLKSIHEVTLLQTEMKIRFSDH